MTHFSRISKIVIDVPAGDHDQELAFWQAATGAQLDRFERHPEYHGAQLYGEHFGLLVQQLEHGQTRIHLDIHTDDLAAELDRLERLGARRVRQVHGWWIMQDPAGLPFCVIPEPPGNLSDDNAQRWS